MIRFLNTSLRRMPRWALLIGSLALIGLAALLDYQTGSEIETTVFYLLPIAAATWYLGRGAGLVFGLLSVVITSVLTWQARPDLPAVHRIQLLNGAVHLGFFVLTAIAVSIMSRQALRLRVLAREDALTGIPNRRAFFGALTRTLEWGRRHGTPWVLGYLDVDDFKKVNDTLGHGEGDAVLRTVARALRDGLRRVDVVARLGGDEFALLLPETDAERAEVVVNKLLDLLSEAMAREGWEVTFSIGVITFLVSPHSVDSAVAAADECMYGVKARGKAGAAFQIWPDRHHLVPGSFKSRQSRRRQA